MAIKTDTAIDRIIEDDISKTDLAIDIAYLIRQIQLPVDQQDRAMIDDVSEKYGWTKD